MTRTARVEIHDASTHALIDVLENAFKIGFEKAANMAPLAWFSLPRDDVKWTAIASFREAWIYDELDTLIDVFRIMPFAETHDDRTAEAKIDCEGYAAVLQDDLVAAELTWTNQPVTQVLADLLAYQTTPRVSLGTVDAALNLSVTYRVSFDNVMKACWELRNVVGGYISVDPVAGSPATRQLNLRASPGNDIGQRVQRGWNLRALGKTTDPTEAVTKIYPLGRGEGNNQQRPSSDLLTAQSATLTQGTAFTRSTLVIASSYSRYKGWTAAGAALPNGSSASDTRTRPLKVFFGATDDTANWEQGVDERTLRSKTNAYAAPAGTPTLNYVHADYLVADDTVTAYGTIARPYPDKRFESSLDLIRAARTVIDEVKVPRVAYDVKVADLARNYPGDPFEQLRLHDQINVVDDVLGVAAKLRIVRTRYEDLWDPNTFAITVGLLETVPSAVRLADRTRKYDAMPDGATCMWVDSFEDNLDATHPYSRDIYVPSDAVVVNKLTLNMRAKPYRYYVSSAIAANEGSHTHNLPGFNRASTTDVEDATHTHTDPQGGSTGSESVTHHHGALAGAGYDLLAFDLTFLPLGATATGSLHTHTITVAPGIVETTTPGSMQLKVDGTVASASATTLTDFDLTPYLTKDSNGKIARGWHTLTFTPDVNGRIQAAVVEVVFNQSRGVVAG